MTILVDYLRKWRLHPSIGKTVSAAYHLNDREAKRELDVFVDNKGLVFQQAPKYLGVRLYQMPNFKQHLEEVAGKVTYRVLLIHRLAGTTWGASGSAKTVRISTQALVLHAAEYCAPVWSRSPHVKKVDVAINSSLRTNMEAGVGSITHQSTSPHMGPRRRRQERRSSESKTLDDSKQTANWDRSIQNTHEEVGTGGQCRM